jgi:hypothetical protein
VWATTMPEPTEPAQAAVWGAYVHARAGERLAAVGVLGHLARELPAQVPAVPSAADPAGRSARPAPERESAPMQALNTSSRR